MVDKQLIKKLTEDKFKLIKLKSIKSNLEKRIEKNTCTKEEMEVNLNKINYQLDIVNNNTSVDIITNISLLLTSILNILTVFDYFKDNVSLKVVFGIAGLLALAYKSYYIGDKKNTKSILNEKKKTYTETKTKVEHENRMLNKELVKVNDEIKELEETIRLQESKLKISTA